MPAPAPARNEGEKLLTSGDVAREFGVTVRQVTNWDKTGVLKLAFRTPGGQRRYRAEDIGRLRGNLPVRSLREDVSTEEIIRLSDTGNLAWKEIGRKFGMSGEGVRRRYHKARRDGPQSDAPRRAGMMTDLRPGRRSVREAAEGSDTENA